METLPLVELLSSYHIPATFVGAFFFGESVIITAAYLTAQLHWSVALVVLAAFLGTVVSDTIWFFVGRLLERRLSRTERFGRQRERIASLLKTLTGTRPALALLFIKFLYGSRIAMIFYLAARQVSLPAFLFFNAIGTLIWLAVIFPLGYIASEGIGQTQSAVRTIEIAAVVLVASAILFRLLSIWLTKRFSKNA